MPNFGFETAGGSSGDAQKDDSWCQVGAGNLYTASTGDTITSYSIYGIGATQTVELAAYDISGGVPQSRIGAAGTATGTGSAGWCTTGAVSHALANGVTYGVGAGKPGAANTFIFYFDFPGGTQRSIDTSSGTLPASWTQASTSISRISMYATYTEGGADYTLTCDNGSFTLSGQTTGLQASRLLTAAQGSIALSGQDAPLAASRLLTAEQGSIALSGQDAAFSVARLLTAEQGSITLSGQDTGLVASRLLTAAQGIFALAGQDATLTYTPSGATYSLVAESGAYTIGGQDVGLRVSRTLSALSGSYTLDGQPVLLLRAYTLEAGQGSYSLSGQPAGLTVSRLLTAGLGSFSLTGQDVLFDYSGEAEPEVTVLPAQRSTPMTGISVRVNYSTGSRSNTSTGRR